MAANTSSCTAHQHMTHTKFLESYVKDLVIPFLFNVPFFLSLEYDEVKLFIFFFVKTLAW